MLQAARPTLFRESPHKSFSSGREKIADVVLERGFAGKIVLAPRSGHDGAIRPMRRAPSRHSLPAPRSKKLLSINSVSSAALQVGDGAKNRAGTEFFLASRGPNAEDEADRLVRPAIAPRPRPGRRARAKPRGFVEVGSDFLPENLLQEKSDRNCDPEYAFDVRGAKPRHPPLPGSCRARALGLRGEEDRENASSDRQRLDQRGGQPCMAWRTFAADPDIFCHVRAGITAGNCGPQRERP